ncbi:MAG: efflux RND transporter periplasmic adaptor subunit [Alcanivoracaceae bacterium]|nr:efflux RND transporter periplasmic adaptor subunit [Alcanivoracaceae bacterium]
MNAFIELILLSLLVLSLSLITPVYAKQEHGQYEKSSSITLSQEQQDLVNIEVEVLKARNLEYNIYAPGEIQANGYTSYLVSPRVDSVVMKRHKALGDHVEKGEKLVTLFSESVAEAQASLKVSKAEWMRVKQLGRKAIGDNRFIKVKIGFELANARLLAFGLSKQAVGDDSIPLGEYSLTAITSGAILTDEFQQGQRVEAGHALMLLSDESQLWVIARIQASIQSDLPIGTLAQVKVGNRFYPAKVSQEAHIIDEKTRTRVIRLLIDNPEDSLHPGEFADVYFSMSTKASVLVEPENAIMRSADGDWLVFIETQDDQFTSIEVNLGRIMGEYREIFGLEAGTKVVTVGAFFVASEIAKGGFDPHGH